MYCPREFFYHELPKGEIVGIFMLANSWVGQNSRSIELFFLFSFRMDYGCVTGRAEPKKREDQANHQGSID